MSTLVWILSPIQHSALHQSLAHTLVLIFHITCSSALTNDTVSYPKNISDVKKGEAKKVQVTERLKGVKSLWGQEEKIYQQGCVELEHTKQVK